MSEPKITPSNFTTTQLQQWLSPIFPSQDILLDPTDCWAYGYDNSRRQALPQAVVFITESKQAQALIKLCHDQQIPLIARGRGTGTTGATIPDHGGIVASFERMNKILEITPKDRLAVVQPGLTNSKLQKALAQHGFFWPPDPSSAGFCSIGGNLACNAAGPKAVKYGTPRENTLGLKAITGTGAEIHCGVRTSKGVVGYDLTRLIIGSEGTLAFITEATLKLVPLPETVRTLRATYANIHGAAQAVAAIMGQPVVPCALEFMDAVALRLAREHTELDIAPQAGALLMIEVDGPLGCIENSIAAVKTAAQNPELLDLDVAANATEVAQLWQARKDLSPTLRKIAPKKINEDVVVPVSRIPEFMEHLQALGQEYAITIVNFGHAGNGNIHVNLLVHPEQPGELQRAEQCLALIFKLVLELGGTLSGEHGVGLEKRDFIAQEIPQNTLVFMHAIKSQFDPKGILNPGKTLPRFAL